jgi:para-aminobenzoate synthetase / 4-amino-4-deoxychorismate lyase
VIQARFDDLRAGRERSFRLVDPVGTVEAVDAKDVAAALARVEDAAHAGLWAAGFVAYEAAPGLDPTLVVRSADRLHALGGLPLLWFGLFRGRDAVRPPEPVDDPTLEPSGHAWRPSVDRAAYDEAIAAIRERIAAGDTYQVNYSLRLHSAIQVQEPDLYRDLCLAQRGGHGAFLATGRHVVLSASPELFFRIDRDRITTRPMKGTARRGRWAEDDERARNTLAASIKDRAENAMIVDLVRSDLGRISLPGSVRVSRAFRPERYETVWQLTSTVRSTLVPGVSVSEVFRALFPSGSVTGAPKVATMRIIAGLEDSPRGVYCGAVGYLAPPGSGDPHANFNVAIRTVVVDGSTGIAEYGVGGGITHDSSAQAELEEVVTKALVLTARRPRFDLFETLRHTPDGGFRHLDDHLNRLEASARYFGFRFEPQDAREALEKAAADLVSDAGVRITLSRNGTIATEAFEAPPEGSRVRMALHPDPVDSADAWLYHKTTVRAALDRRRRDRPDVDDVLLVNQRGEITESTIANVVANVDGTWVTPPLDAGLLPGTYRAALLRGGRIRERAIRVEELGDVRALALVSSVRGWRPAELVP